MPTLSGDVSSRIAGEASSARAVRPAVPSRDQAAPGRSGMRTWILRAALRVPAEQTTPARRVWARRAGTQGQEGPTRESKSGDLAVKCLGDKQEHERPREGSRRGGWGRELGPGVGLSRGSRPGPGGGSGEGVRVPTTVTACLSRPTLRVVTTCPNRNRPEGVPSLRPAAWAPSWGYPVGRSAGWRVVSTDEAGRPPLLLAAELSGESQLLRKISGLRSNMRAVKRRGPSARVGRSGCSNAGLSGPPLCIIRCVCWVCREHLPAWLATSATEPAASRRSSPGSFPLVPPGVPCASS